MSADQQLALARATRGESSHLSKAAQKVVPPFLQKLYEYVHYSLLASISIDKHLRIGS